MIAVPQSTGGAPVTRLHERDHRAGVLAALLVGHRREEGLDVGVGRLRLVLGHAGRLAPRRRGVQRARLDSKHPAAPF